MSNALSIFDGPRISVPAHVASFFAEESNIPDRPTVPALTFEGKVWQVNIDGEKTKMLRRDEDGEMVPVPTIKVVILGFNARRGRAYYPSSYNPDNPGKPECWSDDGIAPHASIAEPKASKCDGCPLAAKGSKQTDDGRSVAACSQHRLLVVVPEKKLDMQPLRMKISVTSDWDKESPDLQKEGWFAFNNYTDMLKSKGVQHTASLVTKMKFDPSKAYPKIIFSPDRWLDDSELAQVAPVVKSQGVKDLLGGTWTPDGAAGTRTDEEEAPAPTPKVEAPKPAPKAAKPAPVAQVVEDAEEEVLERIAAAPAKAPKPAKAAAVVIDAEEEKPAAAASREASGGGASKAAKGGSAAAGASAELPKEVADILAGWGDED
jgi:hypothetical protein